jgi:hypothetical protein
MVKNELFGLLIILALDDVSLKTQAFRSWPRSAPLHRALSLRVRVLGRYGAIRLGYSSQ